MSLGISMLLAMREVKSPLITCFSVTSSCSLGTETMEVNDVSWKGCGDFSEAFSGQEEVDRGLGRFISMAAGTDIAEECSVLKGFCPDSSS